MRSLYEINNDYVNVIENGFSIDEETGEILFDKTNLDELEVEFNEKADNIACYIKDLQALSDGIKNEKSALDERKKSVDTKILSLKEYLSTALKMRDMSKLETTRNKISLRNSKSVEVFNENIIPKTYFNETVVEKLDKKTLLKELKEGKQIDGCRLLEKSNLQLK